MHWADVLAAEAAHHDPPIVLATAITPSGPIHVGNMREVLTTEMTFRSVRDVEKIPCELLYIADSYDPLRKVYPFQDPKVYEPFVGRPLREIPCICGSHKDYADHFLLPFFEALDELGVEMKILDAYDMYQSGRYKEQIEEAMGARERIREIIVAESKRKLPQDWIPFNIQCESCKRLSGTKPTEVVDDLLVNYLCSCGHHGRIDVAKPGAGKLPWRVDWPARWKFLHVDFEAMGKDHAAAGSSWDTGIRIAEEVFGIKAPARTVYEFVQIKGVGAMHSSTGTAISAEEMLRMTPPEVLRFLIAKNQPNKHIDFDPGAGILDLVDAFDEWEKVHFGAQPARTGMNDVARTYELSNPRAPPAKLPLQVPYRHLVTVVQLAPTIDKTFEVLERNDDIPPDLGPEERSRLEHRVNHVRYWLERFAPDEVRFSVQATLPAIGLEPDERKALAGALQALRTVPWKATEIHNALHESAKGQGLKPGLVFSGVYKAFLGRTRGPRAGYLLAQLGKDATLARLEEAVAKAAS